MTNGLTRIFSAMLPSSEPHASPSTAPPPPAPGPVAPQLPRVHSRPSAWLRGVIDPTGARRNKRADVTAGAPPAPDHTPRPAAREAVAALSPDTGPATIKVPQHDQARASFMRRFELQATREAGDEPILLTGQDLTPQHIVDVAVRGVKVGIDADAMNNVQRGFDTVLEAARQGKKVYGLTTGVGQNKDRKVLGQAADQGADAKMAQMLEQSRTFNLTSIRAHTSGTGDPLSTPLVRAGMLIRLNTLLSGAGGVQPAVVESLRDFLNHGITPLIPDCGSIGQADLLLMAHIGLSMAGEWYVVPTDQSGPRSEEDCRLLEQAGFDLQDRATPTRIQRTGDALAEAGLNPVALVGKDFLSMASSNALTAGSTALGVHQAAAFVQREIDVFALCIQGLNGVSGPFMHASTAKGRPFPQATEMAAAIRQAFAGSRLVRQDPARAMQDPISYRTMHHRLGEVVRGIDDTAAALRIQINSSDDNPFVDIDFDLARLEPGHEEEYLVDMGLGKRAAIIPTGNFDSHPFVKPMEQLLSGLGDLSTAMASNVLRFETPEITGQSRFLTADGGHGFGATSKGTVALNDEIVALATPAKHSNLAVAGGQMEDLGNAGSLNAKKLHATVQKLYAMASYQLMYATQAIDLNGEENALGPASKQLYEQYRDKVPFFAQDGESSTALRKGALVIKNWQGVRPQ